MAKVPESAIKQRTKSTFQKDDLIWVGTPNGLVAAKVTYVNGEFIHYKTVLGGNGAAKSNIFERLASDPLH